MGNVNALRLVFLLEADLRSAVLSRKEFFLVYHNVNHKPDFGLSIDTRLWRSHQRYTQPPRRRPHPLWSRRPSLASAVTPRRDIKMSYPRSFVLREGHWAPGFLSWRSEDKSLFFFVGRFATPFGSDSVYESSSKPNALVQKESISDMNHSICSMCRSFMSLLVSRCFYY
jgi:hypothetical protein